MDINNAFYQVRSSHLGVLQRIELKSYTDEWPGLPRGGGTPLGTKNVTASGPYRLPLMLNLYIGCLDGADAPVQPRMGADLANLLGYLGRALGLTPYLVGEELTGADIQMSFIGEFAKAQGKLQPYPNVAAWVQRFQARPAYKKGVERGGAYAFAK